MNSLSAASKYPFCCDHDNCDYLSYTGMGTLSTCYAAQVLRSKYDKINVENSELLMQNINMHIQITIHTHNDKSSSSSKSDSLVQVQDQIVQVF